MNAFVDMLQCFLDPENLKTDIKLKIYTKTITLNGYASELLNNAHMSVKPPEVTRKKTHP